MYIKDSSFYGYVRDTTDAKVLLLQPCFVSLYCASDTVTFGDGAIDLGGTYSLKNGIFEYDTPIMTVMSNQAATLVISGNVDDNGNDYTDEEVISSFASGERKLAVIVVFSVDENGVLYAPSNSDKVELFPISEVGESGYFEREILISAEERGVQIESINVCECIEVDSTKIESMGLKEKNDIILSSIPYNDLNLTLFDGDEDYYNFVTRAGRHLRVLSYFQYNDIYSQTFLHFYDEKPIIDRNKRPSRSTFSFTGIMGAMNKDVFHNTSDGELMLLTEGFEKTIGAEYVASNGTVYPSYLEMIITSFNANYKISSVIHSATHSLYGGHFAKLKSYNNTYWHTCVEFGDGTAVSSIREQPHFTRIPAEGYTHADAIRLLINAQCHGMRVKNETIIGDKVENLINESGAVFTSKEYLSVPQATDYGDIDIIKVSSSYSSVEEQKYLCSFDIDMGNDGTWGKDDGGDFIRFKNFFLDQSVASGDFVWGYNVISGSFYGNIRLEHKGRVITVIWNDNVVSPPTAKITVGIWGCPVKIEAGNTAVFTYGPGQETIEISNPFMIEKNETMTTGITDDYAKFNYDYQANKRIYSLDVRGRFDVHPLDRVLYQTERGDLRKGVVIEHTLEYNGAMRSTFRIIDDGDVESVYCSDGLLCSEILICR